ncbi:MAG: hypothetical protein QOF51_3162 [Chloroflexota bacterium]|nr:hypothetical protein [Chloroflexota bacterium]
MSRTFDLLSFYGITIRAHASALLGFATLVLLGGRIYPALLPNETEQTYISVAFISAFFVFFSRIAHELGHSVVARLRGVAVGAITLVMFGGSSDIRNERGRPLDELFIFLSGPTVSLSLAFLLALVLVYVPGLSQPLSLFLESMLLLNLWLGGFNLLPTLPLDGGRALRGLLWYRVGDFRRATRLATLFGQGVAALAFAGAIILLVVSLDERTRPYQSILGYDPRFVAVAGVLLSWFIYNGARAAYRQVILQSRFAGVSVRQIMTPEPDTVAPWTSIEEAVTDHFLKRGERGIAVAREGGQLVGLVAFSDTRKVPRSEWGKRAVGEVMTPLAQLTTVSPDDGVDVAIRHMAEQHYNQLPVVVNGQLVGIIARLNVLRYMELKDHTGDESK